MANYQDARPFVDLQKDAEEFVAKFEEDIAEFKTVLDSKITSLICDPDSFGSPGTYEKNPLIEFSKAKYAIFISMKSLVNDREKEWIKYLAEMKKLFLENVEIFLAGTKLEVKITSSECQSIPGTKKSPGNRKSSLVPSSLYPIISNFTKNIPALSSSLQSKEVHSFESEEAIVSPRNRSLFYQGIDKMEIDKVEMDLNTSQSSSRCRRSAKLNTSDLNASLIPSREKRMSKETHELNSHVLPNVSMDLEEIVTVKPKISKLQRRGNKSRPAAQNKKSKGILKKVSGSKSQEEASEFELGVQVSSSESQEDEEFELEKNSSELLRGRGRGRGRRDKKPAVDENTGKYTTSAESEEINEVDQRPTHIKSRKSVRETSRRNKTAVSKMSGQSSSEDNEKLLEAEISTNIPPLKGRRGKQALKSEEKENVFKPENQVDEGVHKEELNAPSDIPATRKGRSATAKSFVKPSDPPLVSNTRRGRSTTKEEGKATRVSGKRAGRKSLNERVSESDTSISPVKIILPVEEDIDDDLDVCTPVARPTKSSARRKTLLLNVDEPASGTVKGNSTRAKSKRKTISGVSDLASVAPSKRLKISSSQNAITEDEVAVGDDNLMGKNDSYSDWIGLKNVDGKIPTSPAIYEVKVWRAKKTAYIGSCESLRQMLTLHKLKQNSGHKHLDKFIERNYDDIQVRYEVATSLNGAKAEVKNRIKTFVAQHKTTPAYN